MCASHASTGNVTWKFATKYVSWKHLCFEIDTYNVPSSCHCIFAVMLRVTFNVSNYYRCRSQWLCGPRLRSSAARLLRLWVRIPLGAWIFVCCECFVLSGRGLCDGLITCPEESYRQWRVVVCDHETSKTRRLKPATGLWKCNQNGCNARKTNKTTIDTVLASAICGLVISILALSSSNTDSHFSLVFVHFR